MAGHDDFRLADALRRGPFTFRRASAHKVARGPYILCVRLLGMNGR